MQAVRLERVAEVETAGAAHDHAIVGVVLAPLNRTPLSWVVAMTVCAGGTVLWVVSIAYTLWLGIGAWGNNIPVAWAFAIVNFVWWIGIGHAGTFISAILLLLFQKWRTTINRFTEG